jgi:cytidyltransferase-like protein
LDTQTIRRILGGVYASDLIRHSGEASNESNLQLDLIANEIYSEELKKLGFLENVERGVLRLTERGRKEIVVVMAGGSFDIIHPGHVETLEKARALGDVLVVSVARNSTYLRNKKRDPLHDEKLRKKMVESIKFVDAAILGSEVDLFETVELVRPDIIALGYDQSHNEDGFRKEISRRGLRAKVVRLDSSVPEIKTSKIAKDYY